MFCIWCVFCGLGDLVCSESVMFCLVDFVFSFGGLGCGCIIVLCVESVSLEDLLD